MNHDPIEQDLRDGLTPEQHRVDNVVNGVMDRLPERRRRRGPRAWAALLVAGLGIAILLARRWERV